MLKAASSLSDNKILSEAASNIMELKQQLRRKFSFLKKASS